MRYPKKAQEHYDKLVVGGVKHKAAQDAIWNQLLNPVDNLPDFLTAAQRKELNNLMREGAKRGDVLQWFSTLEKSAAKKKAAKEEETATA